MKPALFETTVILGIPIDNLGLDEAVNRIFSMADAYGTDGRPRIAVAVSTDTIINLHSHARTGSGQKEELVNALRQSDLMIPMGRPMAWAARIVGTRLKPAFSESQWFAKFLDHAEKRQKSLFLLGNHAGGMHFAAHLIRPAYPALKLSGSAVFGSRHDSKPDTDNSAALLEQINSSAPDFLVTDLQDPRAGAWLARYRHRLYVPVTLAVCGTSQIQAAAGKFRSKRPGKSSRLFYGAWQRFAYTPMMFGFTILPLVLYQQYRHLVHKLFHVQPPVPWMKTRLSRAEQGTILKIIALPDPLDASVVGEIKDELKQMIQHASKIVVDLSGVRFMDSSGLGLLLVLWRTAAAQNRQMFLVGVRPSIYRFFKLSRTLDFFEKSIFPDLDEIIGFLSRKAGLSSFHYLAVIRGRNVVFHLYGELDAPRIADIDFPAVTEAMGDRNAIFNLAGLKFIDSAGMHLFIQIQRHAARHGRTCIFCALQAPVRQMFHILHMDPLFAIAEDIAQAEHLLHRIDSDAKRQHWRHSRSYPGDETT